MAWNYEYADTLQKVVVNTPAGEVECVAASYNGVPFFVKVAKSSGGREIITSVLPFSDKHVNEDSGKKVRSFSCTIYLVGINCDVDREKLEEEFNKEGYFELVHPYYGKFNARCPAYEFEYNSDIQEYVTGEVTFVQESEPKQSARSVEDLRGVSIEKSASVLTSAKSNFVENFSIVSKAKSIVDTVVGYTNQALDMIENARSSLRNVAEFVNEISKIRENIELILNAPADFASRLQDLLTMVKETFSTEDAANNYVNESLTIMSDTISARAGSSDLVAGEMTGYIDQLMVASAASMVARSVVDCSFKSADEAGELQTRVSESFRVAAESATSIEDYANIMDLQATSLKYLRDEMSKLAVVVELPLAGSRDILSVCFDCYGDLDRIDDILERNQIGDPLIVNRSIKVLSK